jgi:pimeloyl-ACP methyl ester carboxylesterase
LETGLFFSGKNPSLNNELHLHTNQIMTFSPILLQTTERGHGPLTLVFLHYFGGSRHEWKTVINQLTDKYHCIACDLRGHGDSPAPETGYSVDDMTDDVVATLAQLAVGQYVLIGHSMSGKVALNLASRRPAGLQQVLLVAPSPPHPEPISDEDRNEMLATQGMKKAAVATFEKITVKPVSDADRDQIIADNVRTSKAAWDAWLTLGSKEDIADRMNRIDIPIAIITGANDNALSPDVQPELTLPTLPNATFEILDGVGHLIPYETPNALVSFIAKKITPGLPGNS